MSSTSTPSHVDSLCSCVEVLQSSLLLGKSLGKRTYNDFLPFSPSPSPPDSAASESELPSYGIETPTLVRCVKKFKPDALQPTSELQKLIPDDVIGHILGFVGSLDDRFAIQATCRQFQRLSNSDEMLKTVHLGGDVLTGKGGIFQDNDSVETAIEKVSTFARAGNAEALYLLGMIHTYCKPHVEGGVLILQRAAEEGHARADYILGLVLRDSSPVEAILHMQKAAHNNYLPALQETLPNREMKSKFGELSAAQLRPYIDPVCLNRLLGRHYINNTTLRRLNTSHCWNPLCGRWAFKAQLHSVPDVLRVSRMKMCSRCCRAKYCSKLCQVYDWRSGRHKTECQFL